MSFYKEHAKDLKKFLEANPEKCDISYMKTQIKVYEFLGDLPEGGIYELFNTGAFNDILKAYTEMAAKNIGLTEDQAHQLTRELNYCLDMTGAKQALKAAGYSVKE